MTVNFLYEVHVYNLDAIIIIKSRSCGSPKIIMIITSLTSNKCIDAKIKLLIFFLKKKNQYENGVNNILQCITR
jgi:hypothetical protein